MAILCQSWFLGQAGKLVSLKDTIEGFAQIVDGSCDHIPESAFYMVGGLQDVKDKS